MWPLDRIAQHMINKQTAIYNAMNKLIFRTTSKQKWRKCKKRTILKYMDEWLWSLIARQSIGNKWSISYVLTLHYSDVVLLQTLKRHYISRQSVEAEPHAVVLLVCAIVSSSCGQLATYPLTLVRTRLQANSECDSVFNSLLIFSVLLPVARPQDVNWC